MAQFALCLHLLEDVVGTGATVFLVAFSAVGMDQIEVEIFHAAGFQLVFDQGANIFFFFKEVGRKLICKQEFAALIAISQAGFQRFFAAQPVIGAGGIKIVLAHSTGTPSETMQDRPAACASTRVTGRPS